MPNQWAGGGQIQIEGGGDDIQLLYTIIFLIVNHDLVTYYSCTCK